ncbi:MAG: PHB depolymerase family esterase [Flavobacteriales bacterium]|nr:PHB depolymerase family esterase [Flavobacteriales bacterium]
MKTFFSLFFVLLFYLCQAQEEEVQQVLDFGKNQGNLNMFTHIPQGLDKTKTIPLVVVMHGCTQTAGSVSHASGWSKMADKYGFYVVFPQQKMSNNPQNCFNFFYLHDINKGQGESGSIMEMIDHMKANYSIDSTQVFAAGLSAGAAMTTVLLATYPNVFNSGAVLAGGPYKAGKNPIAAASGMAGWIDKTPQEWGGLVREQNPNYTGKYPRLVIYQGTMDPIVNKQNAYELVEQWANLHQINSIPDHTDSSFTSNDRVLRMAYENHFDEEVIVHYEIENLVHALPINRGICEAQGGSSGLFTRDIDFYSTYWILADWGLISFPRIEQVSDNEFAVSPLPASYYYWTTADSCKISAGQGSPEIKVDCDNTGRLNVLRTDSTGCFFRFPTYLSQ